MNAEAAAGVEHPNSVPGDRPDKVADIALLCGRNVRKDRPFEHRLGESRPGDHAHGKSIPLLEYRGYVEAERLVVDLVAAKERAVKPYFGLPFDAREVQEHALAAFRGVGLEDGPVPKDTTQWHLSLGRSPCHSAIAALSPSPRPNHRSPCATNRGAGGLTPVAALANSNFEHHVPGNSMRERR